MPNTPIFGWPYQSLPDSPDGAKLGQLLALAIEATVNALNAIVSGHTTSIANAPKGIVARAKRSAAKAGITAEVGVERLDGVVLTAGRTYRVTTGEGQYNSTVNEAAQIQAQLKVDQTGAAATTASPVLAIGRVVTQAGTGGGSKHPEFHIYPAVTVTMSVLLTVTRTVGAGTITAAGPDGLGSEIVVEDLGLTPTNTGVDI